MKRTRALGVLLCAATAMLARQRDASACGGCLQPAPPPGEVESVITDEQMMLAISIDQTTLYDSIRYSGSPKSFAWVLPIRGEVTVGLSAEILFATINGITTTSVIPPTFSCPGSSGGDGGGSSGGEGGSGSSGGDGGGVTVIAQSQVGPYETVQLKSSDGSALDNWLASHGYVIPAADAPVIAAYVKEHFDFLAMKLVPGVGVQAMQPVRITSKGASVSLPLHMVAVGTGSTTGITIWVVAEGRWEPQNFPTFTIADSEIVWDWNTYSSNYESLRLAKEDSFGGRGWQIESSLELNKTLIENNLLSNIQFGDGEAGVYPVDAGSDAGEGGVATGSSESDLATADLDVLFKGISGSNVRVTRMRSDVAHSALSVDMILQASADQSQLTNLLHPTQTIGDPCASAGDGGLFGGGTGGLGFPRGSSDSGAAPSPVGDSAGCSTTGPRDDPQSMFVLLGLAAFGAYRFRTRRARPPR